MKKIVRLTESDLENIVRKVIQEQSAGLAFGGEGNGFMMKREPKEQISSQVSDLNTKWGSMFPKPMWYNEARKKKIDFRNYEETKDPEFQKLYSAYRTFIDDKVPEISQGTNEDFYQWMESFVDNGTYHNLATKYNNDINLVAQLFNGMLPVLKISNYPNTQKYELALTKAHKIDPSLKTNKFFNTVHPVAKRAYEMITQA
jgi:hypothetical protein